MADFQQLTSLSAAASLTVPDDAVGALIGCDTQNVRMRADGTAPTATVGILLVAAAVPLRIESRALLLAAKFIEVTTSAKLNVQYLYSVE